MASPKVQQYLNMLETGNGTSIGFPKNALIGSALGTGIGAGGGAGLITLFNALSNKNSISPLIGALPGGFLGAGIGGSLGLKKDASDPNRPLNMLYAQMSNQEKMELENILNGNTY